MVRPTCARAAARPEPNPGGPAKVREVALSAGRRLVDVRGTVDEVLAKGRGLPDAHLRVEVLTEGPVPGLNDRVRDELPNAVDVRIFYERVEAESAGPPISSLASRDQFISFYRTEHGVDQVPAEVLDAFDEVAELEGA